MITKVSTEILSNTCFNRPHRQPAEPVLLARRVAVLIAVVFLRAIGGFLAMGIIGLIGAIVLSVGRHGSSHSLGAADPLEAADRREACLPDAYFCKNPYRALGGNRQNRNGASRRGLPLYTPAMALFCRTRTTTRRFSACPCSVLALPTCSLSPIAPGASILVSGTFPC
jgi:hypothetical protein